MSAKKSVIENCQEGFIETMHGIVSEDAIIAFFKQDSQTTMVYIGDDQYNIKVGIEELLSRLGGEKEFVKLGDDMSMSRQIVFVRRSVIVSINVANYSQEEVSVGLNGRSRPITWGQLPIEHFYERLG